MIHLISENTLDYFAYVEVATKSAYITKRKTIS